VKKEIASIKVEIIPLAERDIDQAAEYYRAQRIGLNIEFLAEIDVDVGAIAANPTSFEQVRPGIRRYIVNRIPYQVFYRLPDFATVRITIVRHHARRPSYGMWRK
jgi:plasmid stabilization system protein ParE